MPRTYASDPIKVQEIEQLNNSISTLHSQGADADSLIARKKSIEIQMSTQALRYGNAYDGICSDWQQIQAQLTKDDCVIEFSTFKDLDASVVYAATVFSRDVVPFTLRLFKENEMDAETVDYNDSRWYQLIWKPILERVPTATNVYFSPAGNLYRVNIESLCINDSVYVFDEHNYYRLSSSKQLLNSHPQTISSIYIYGGIDYDNRASNAASSQWSEEDSKLLLSNLQRSTLMSSQGGIAYLPNTKKEAEEISLALSRKIAVKTFVGDEGTESSFKSISGCSPSIIHLATHGFYLADEETNGLKIPFLSFLSNDNIAQSEKQLSTSGLLFAGVNQTLLGSCSDIGDDGILTAREVSNMHLGNTDLAVLSACQTALGEISSEGVYGLQRGFKMAGVNSLLVSLWNVDDAATQMLMTQFYSNLMNKKTKRQSLLEAQRYVCNYEKEETVDLNASLTPNQRRQLERQGKTVESKLVTQKVRPYANPKYWAAFVLMDGLD